MILQFTLQNMIHIIHILLDRVGMSEYSVFESYKNI